MCAQQAEQDAAEGDLLQQDRANWDDHQRGRQRDRKTHRRQDGPRSYGG
jgi:hypothetical protein